MEIYGSWRHELGQFKVMSRQELRARRKLSGDELILFDQFRAHLARLKSDEVVLYQPTSPAEETSRSRTLLRQAARALGLTIRIKEEPDGLMFYRKRMRAGRRRGKAAKVPDSKPGVREK